MARDRTERGKDLLEDADEIRPPGRILEVLRDEAHRDPESKVGTMLVHQHEAMYYSIRCYALLGDRVGDAAHCLLSNDLFGTVGHADLDLVVALDDFVRWINNYLPEPCWGSEYAIEAWQMHTGLYGKYLEQHDGDHSEARTALNDYASSI